MSSKILRGIKIALIVIAGNALYAAAVTFFIVPNQLVLGGFTGLSIAISHFIKINVSCAVLLFHSAAFLAGAAVLGKEFAISTAASTFVYPLLLHFTERLAEQMPLPIRGSLSLNALIAAVLIGLSLGLLTKNAASTGGTEVIPLIVKKRTGKPVGRSLLIIDGGIMLLGLMYSDWVKVVYGVLIVLVYSAIVQLLNRGDRITAQCKRIHKASE